MSLTNAIYDRMSKINLIDPIFVYRSPFLQNDQFWWRTFTNKHHMRAVLHTSTVNIVFHGMRKYEYEGQSKSIRILKKFCTSDNQFK